MIYGVTSKVYGESRDSDTNENVSSEVDQDEDEEECEKEFLVIDDGSQPVRKRRKSNASTVGGDLPMRQLSGAEIGQKNIGLFAGAMLLINNITGPGVPELANLFAEAGWFLPVLCMTFIWIMATLSASMYCEAMRHIPGNEHFCGRIEYTSIVRFYFGDRSYIFAQIGLNGALQSFNVISVVQCVRIMDNLISAAFGMSCALNLTPFSYEWTDPTGTNVPVVGSSSIISCQNTNHIEGGHAWGCHIVVSLGFVSMLVLVAPCAKWNLEESMIVQKVSFFLTSACWIVWAAVSMFVSTAPELDARVIAPVNTNEMTGAQSSVLGIILFNFGFVTTVPSWVNEKHPAVSINASLWGSTMTCLFVFLLVGVPGAYAYQDLLKGPASNTCVKQTFDAAYNCHTNLMTLLADAESVPVSLEGYGKARILGKTSAYIFPLVSVASTIPVISIIVKYNMLENGFSRRFSLFWGALFPWLVSLPLLYMPNVLAEIINLTSLVFVTVTNFVVPLMIYRKLQFIEMDPYPSRQLSSDKIHPPAGVHVHHALPPSWNLSENAKLQFATAIAVILSLASLTVLVQSVQQSTFSLNAASCAHVGS